MSAITGRHHILLVLALSGCAAEPPIYTPPAAPARHTEELGMDVAAPGDAHEGRASGVRGMNYEQLQACAHDKARITTQEKKLHVQLGGIDALQKSVDAEGAAIEASRRLVDARSQQSVDDYNARILKYQETVRGLNSDVELYNSSVAELSTEARAYSVACNNRPYRESDREKLPAELRDVMGKDSRPFDLPVVFDDEKGQTVHIGP